jgi:outer membrane protein
MKKIIYIIAVVLLAGAGDAQAQKFGYVDIDALVKVMPQRDSIEKGNKEFLAEREKALQEMYAIYKRRIAEYDSAQTKNVSKESLQELAIGIKGLEDRINTMQQNVNQQIQDRAMAGETYLIELIKNACNKVAKAQGITYVFDKGTLLAFEGGTDLTELVSKELTKGKAVPPKTGGK